MVAYRLDGVFLAAAHPIRRRIIEILLDGSLTINELAGRFSVTRQSVSKHLEILKRVEVIDTNYTGRECKVTLKPQSLQSIDEWLKKYRKYWKTRLYSLKRFAEADEKRK